MGALGVELEELGVECLELNEVPADDVGIPVNALVDTELSEARVQDTMYAPVQFPTDARTWWAMVDTGA